MGRGGAEKNGGKRRREKKGSVEGFAPQSTQNGSKADLGPEK